MANFEPGSLDELHTERLRLCRPTPADRDELLRFHADPVVMETLGGVRDEALTDAYFTAVAYRTLRVIGRFGVLALELDKPGYFERYAPRMAQHTMRALDKLGEEDLADLLFQRSPIFS